MATKRYNEQSFYIETSKGTYAFYAWTTNTRNGFCHSVWCCNTDQQTKVSYCNRTWESYDYQTALLNAFDKIRDKEIREELKAWDKQHNDEIHHRCEAQVKAFEKAYNAAPQELKDTLAKSDIMLNSEEDVKTMTAVLTASAILSK